MFIVALPIVGKDEFHFELINTVLSQRLAHVRLMRCVLVSKFSGLVNTQQNSRHGFTPKHNPRNKNKYLSIKVAIYIMIKSLFKTTEKQ